MQYANILPQIELTPKPKIKKIIKTFYLDSNLYQQFQEVADKDERKYSNIVNGFIRRYVESKS